MEYKCRFCGYRFKDRDEQICPECLTAREEDISCGAFSPEDHSHARFSDSTPYMSSAGADTLRDPKAEFLAEERREESRTSASKYEQAEARQMERQRREAALNAARAQRTSYTRPQGPYTPPPRTQVVGGRVYNVPAGSQPQPVKKKSGCSTFIVIVVFFFVFFILPILAASNDDDEDDTDRSYVFTETQSDDVEPEELVDQDLPTELFANYSDVISEADGYVLRENYISCFPNSFYISDDQAACLTIADSDGNMLNYDNIADKSALMLHSSYSVVPDDGHGTTDFYIKEILCVGFDADENIVSSYEVPQSDLLDLEKEDSGEAASIVAPLYCSEDSENVDIIVTVVFNEVTQDHTFRVNRTENNVEFDYED